VAGGGLLVEGGQGASMVGGRRPSLYCYLVSTYNFVDVGWELELGVEG
jgi:hypothetical protein